MKCEFEEKQYEGPLNRELTTRADVYIPGQKFEEKVGIDAALFSRNRRFWKLWYKKRWWWPPFFPRHKPGVYLKPDFWDRLQETLDSQVFPKFKFNLFIQHKRPEYITSFLGKEYKRWRQPYFRYDITPHQQDVLYRLEQKVSPGAIVVYGCPAFWRFAQLWSFITSQKLVESSNFVQPHILKGHQRYTFVSGGKDGEAFSKPKEARGLLLLKEIDRMQKLEDIGFNSNSSFIFSLSARIMEVVEDSDEEFKMGYFTVRESARSPEHSLAISFTNIFVFTFVASVSWGIGYSED